MGVRKKKKICSLLPTATWNGKSSQGRSFGLCHSSPDLGGNSGENREYSTLSSRIPRLKTVATNRGLDSGQWPESSMTIIDVTGVLSWITDGGDDCLWTLSVDPSAEDRRWLEITGLRVRPISAFERGGLPTFLTERTEAASLRASGGIRRSPVPISASV